ncbi:hypothetical protein C922_04243 [Plasmodium inui San Antonio 1]|uniref:C-CAP/cofactor C-like domain-containing protein n=1 Tax=Plasmodium inui San Antonio 1 TaxID=1237626 RepID=W7A0Y8_9APIC|nr:hypothetical protein C922_04243 [Plasmodium inui San Antonio 1]EUD65300.1 hypothetical protein C922_04243 [Plasmodium inui San Antonio 1]
MKLPFRIALLVLLLLGLICAKDNPTKPRKTDKYRNKFRKHHKIPTLSSDPDRNFLQMKSAHIYNPSIAYRDLFDNNAMGTSTIYYNRLMWGAVIFLFMFILVSSIGVFLYVNKLENSAPEKRHVKNATNYYVVNPTAPYAMHLPSSSLKEVSLEGRRAKSLTTWTGILFTIACRGMAWDGNGLFPPVNLTDNHWDVSNYKNEKVVTLNQVQVNNAVNIYHCEGTTFVIENDKFKSLSMHKCVKCNVVLKNLISSIEIISSSKIKVQVLGNCSSISIDKSAGVQIYLSKENSESEFTTALSSEMNIHIENENGEWTEITIPEQFQHRLENGKLLTRVSDLYAF